MKNRHLIHIGSMMMMYCTLVSMRSCDLNSRHDVGTSEYEIFHPYIAAWVIGLNILVYGLVNLNKEHHWW